MTAQGFRMTQNQSPLVAKDVLVAVRGGDAAGGLLPSVVTYHPDRAASAFLMLLP